MNRWILVAIVMVAFAANSLLNRAALENTDTGPSSFAALRLVSGALFLFVLCWFSGRRDAFAPSRQTLMNALTLGLYMVGFSFAYVGLASGTGALILFGGVQITMFAGSLIAREPMPPLRLIGAAIAFGGLVWFMGPTSGSGAERPDLWSAALMCVAAFGWGIFSLLGRRSTEPLGNMAASFVWCVPLGALAWLVRPDALDIGGAILAIVAGTLTSGLGYALWYRVLPQLASSHAAVAQLTVPLIASVGGLIFLSEPLTVRLLIASALVLGGVFISLRAK